MGIDLEGPISIEGEDTVVVDGLPDLLNAVQKVQLHDLLLFFSVTHSQQEMLSQFVIAKIYVSLTSQGSSYSYSK